MWEGIDKRKFPRVKYKCQIQIMGQGQGDVFNTVTENIGAGGVCVTLGKEVDLFKNAKVEIHLAGGSRPIVCQGTIVWVIRRRSDTPQNNFDYDTGIEFTDISEDDRVMLSGLVDDILSA